MQSALQILLLVRRYEKRIAYFQQALDSRDLEIDNLRRTLYDNEYDTCADCGKWVWTNESVHDLEVYYDHDTNEFKCNDCMSDYDSLPSD